MNLRAKRHHGLVDERSAILKKKVGGILVVLDHVSFVQNDSLPSRFVEIRISVPSERSGARVVRRQNHVVIQKASQLPGIAPDTQFEQCSIVDDAAAKRVGLQVIDDFVLPEIKKRKRTDDQRTALESNRTIEVAKNVFLCLVRNRTDRLSVLPAVQQQERKHGDGLAEPHLVCDDASFHLVKVRRVFERRQAKQGAKIERRFVGKEVSFPHAVVVRVSLFVKHVLPLLSLHHPKQRLQLVFAQHDAAQSLERRNHR